MSIKKKTYTPHWVVDQSIRTLCNGSLKAPVRISVYDWDKRTDHDLIGVCNVSFANLVRDRHSTFKLVHPDKPGKGRGEISFENVVHTSVKTFMDLVREGLNMNIAMAVDFTGSNGDPNDPNSLHYYHTGENQYQEGIRRIGQVILEYDTDRDIPLKGFGGQPRGWRDVSHCFDLVPNLNLFGVEKAIDAYKTALANVALSRPTLFQEIIQDTMSKAQSQEGTKNYHVLVIFTDGIINDMDQVISDVVSASNLPMSIIIIGVGNADFTGMHRLDADDRPLTDSRGFKTTRDIVQFVEMNEVRRKGNVSLGQATLAELPAQTETYFMGNGANAFTN